MESVEGEAAAPHQGGSHNGAPQRDAPLHYCRPLPDARQKNSLWNEEIRGDTTILTMETQLRPPASSGTGARPSSMSCERGFFENYEDPIENTPPRKVLKEHESKSRTADANIDGWSGVSALVWGVAASALGHTTALWSTE